MAAIVVFVMFVLAAAQSNNSVGAQRNSVTVVVFHSGVVISDCLTKSPSQFHSYVAFIIINHSLIILVIFCDFA